LLLSSLCYFASSLRFSLSFSLTEGKSTHFEHLFVHLPLAQRDEYSFEITRPFSVIPANAGTQLAASA
jgi:hypothetical protein